jgi:hypothetical protein
MKNKMQKRFRNTVSTVRKSHSMMLAACRRRNSLQLESSRRGAGSIPASRRIVQTVLAAIAAPAHAPPKPSPDGRGDDADTPSGAPPTPDASAAASPATPRTTTTPTEAARD